MTYQSQSTPTGLPVREPKTLRAPTVALLASVLLLTLGGCSTTVVSDDAATTGPRAEQKLWNTPDYTLFELRTYTTHDGKLPALHERFRDHTRALFERHGIRNVGYWIPTQTPNTLIYIVAHKDKASAASAWQAFIADPDWKTVYADSQRDGPLVAKIDSVFMTETDYSTLR